jgi:hypothetical protein
MSEMVSETDGVVVDRKVLQVGLGCCLNNQQQPCAVTPQQQPAHTSRQPCLSQPESGRCWHICVNLFGTDGVDRQVVQAGLAGCLSMLP